MAIVYTNDLDLKGNRIHNLGLPQTASDAASKQYVDGIATGLSWKEAVRAGSDSDISLSAPGVIDGVTLASGDRVLVFGQTNAAENGIYSFNGTALVRAQDADDPGELEPGSAVTVAEGTNNGNHTFVLITDGQITIGTTPQTWSLLNSGTSQVLTEGDGIDITNSVVSVVPAPNAGLSVGPAGVGGLADLDGGVSIGTNGFAVKVVPDSGLSVDTNGVAAVLAPDKGLAVDSAGLQVKAGNGVATDATGVNVVAAPDKGLVVDATGVSVLVRPDDGLDVDATGIGVTTDPAGALATSATGLAVVPTADTGLAVDATGLHTVLDPDGAVATSATGLKVVAAPALVDVPGGAPLIVGTDGIALNSDALPKMGKFAQSLGDGTASTILVNHNLNNIDVLAEVFEVSSGQSVYADISRTDANNISVDFGNPPSSGQYRIVVMG